MPLKTFVEQFAHSETFLPLHKCCLFFFISTKWTPNTPFPSVLLAGLWQYVNHDNIVRSIPSYLYMHEINCLFRNKNKFPWFDIRCFFPLGLHRFEWCGRTQGLQKQTNNQTNNQTNKPSIERSFYLLNTRTICAFFLYFYIDGFSLLLQRQFRKGNDA